MIATNDWPAAEKFLSFRAASLARSTSLTRLTVNKLVRAPNPAAMALVIRSSAFGEGQEIPPAYTCNGRDISPPLSWSGVPAETKSLALIVDDPDAPDPAAPKRIWVHWILYNVRSTSNGLPEAVKGTSLPKGSSEG